MIGVTARTRHQAGTYGTALVVAMGRYRSYRCHVACVVRGVLGQWVSRWVGGGGGGGGVVVALLDGRGATGITHTDQEQSPAILWRLAAETPAA